MKKVKYYIKLKTHKFIVLRFWIESGINVLCEVMLSSHLFTPLIPFLEAYHSD